MVFGNSSIKLCESNNCWMVGSVQVLHGGGGDVPLLTTVCMVGCVALL